MAWRKETARSVPQPEEMLLGVAAPIQPFNNKEETARGDAIQMDYNESKYWVDSDLLTEAEKVQFAKGLLQLENQGVIEYRDGHWGLAAGVEIAETPEGPVARFRNKERESN